jgi:multidrug transporter EmrE-like cation transporter
MILLITAIVSIVISVGAQFCLKAGMSSTEIKEALMLPFSPRLVVQVLTNKFVVGGFLLYGIGALTWLGVLARWDVSKAYPLVGLGFALTAVVGLILGETVTAFRILGVSLIVAGVWVVANT